MNSEETIRSLAGHVSREMLASYCGPAKLKSKNFEREQAILQLTGWRDGQSRPIDDVAFPARSRNEETEALGHTNEMGTSGRQEYGSYLLDFNGGPGRI